MGVGDYTEPSHRDRHRHPRGHRHPRQRQPVPLKRLFRYYLYAMAASLGGAVLFAVIGSPLGILGWLLVHLYAGWSLNRAILPHFRWHILSNTVANVARIKLAALFFWPFQYLIFLIQVWAVRSL